MAKRYLLVPLLVIFVVIKTWSQETQSYVHIAKDNVNCLYGLKNEDGDWVLKPTHELITKFDGNYDDAGYFLAHEFYQDRELFGLYNSAGKLIIPVEYHGIEPLVNWYGRENYHIEPVNGFFEVQIDQKFGLARDGKVVVPVQYDKIRHQGQGVIALILGEKIALADLEGHALSDKTFDAVDGFSNGYAIVKQGKLFGAIDPKGNITLPVEYDVVWPFNKYGQSQASKKGEVGIIDSKGKWVLRSKIFPHPEYTENRIFCKTDEGEYTLTDRGGKKIQKLQVQYARFERIVDDREVVSILFKENNRYGLCDLQGTVKCKAEYDTITHGFFKKGKKYGLINLRTQTIVFDDCDWGRVDGDLAYFIKNRKHTLINLINFQTEDVAKRGYPRISVFNLDDPDVTFVVDMVSGDVIMPPTARNDVVFSNDFIFYKDSIGHGMQINRQTGEKVAMDDWYLTRENFTEDLDFVMQQDSLLGVVDHDNNIVLPARFKGILKSDDGEYAIVVTKNRKAGVINNYGKIIIDTLYDQVEFPITHDERSLSWVKSEAGWGLLEVGKGFLTPDTLLAPGEMRYDCVIVNDAQGGKKIYDLVSKKESATYDDIRPMDFSREEINGDELKLPACWMHKNGYWELRDAEERMLLRERFESIRMIVERNYFLTNGDRYSVVNREGKLVWRDVERPFYKRTEDLAALFQTANASGVSEAMEADSRVSVLIDKPKIVESPFPKQQHMLNNYLTERIYLDVGSESSDAGSSHAVDEGTFGYTAKGIDGLIISEREFNGEDDYGRSEAEERTYYSIQYFGNANASLKRAHVMFEYRYSRVDYTYYNFFFTGDEIQEFKLDDNVFVKGYEQQFNAFMVEALQHIDVPMEQCPDRDNLWTTMKDSFYLTKKGIAFFYRYTDAIDTEDEGYFTLDIPLARFKHLIRADGPLGGFGK